MKSYLVLDLYSASFAGDTLNPQNHWHKQFCYAILIIWCSWAPLNDTVYSISFLELGIFLLMVPFSDFLKNLMLSCNFLCTLWTEDNVQIPLVGIT